MRVNVCVFQAACLRFFNKLLSSTEGADAKVYIQHELELAGFDAEQLEKVCSIVYLNYACSDLNSSRQF